jgi:cysteine desulfurase/selenocysteine lyase
MATDKILIVDVHIIYWLEFFYHHGSIITSKMDNIEKIRKDFPLLSGDQGKVPIYFDNACMSLKPNTVIEAMAEYYNKYPACGGRSGHRLAEKVNQKCQQARKIIAEFVGAKKESEIIFTRNTTEGINLVANSLEFQPGDIIITSDKEHNSNLVPWQLLSKKKKIIHKVIPSQTDNTFNLQKFEEMMSDRVKLVALGLTSNLDGVTIPAKKIIALAHKFGAMVILDAAQSAPHHKIDVIDLDVDFLAFSGHKMLGPTGTGALYGKYALLEQMGPFMVGGDTVEYSTYEGFELLAPPEKFEAGLQDYAGIISFGEAVRYLQTIGMANIADQEYLLNKFITEQILEMPGFKIIGPADAARRSGIISFYHDKIDAHQLALMLEESAGILIRAGQHCVHSWFNARNIHSAARVSLYFYNTLEEAKVFVDSLKKIIKII